jgi:hypothetical protein
LAYSPPGTFIPENAGFPDLGQTYVDPVFGTTIKRLTKTPHNLSGYDGGDIYERQGWWSANGTYFVHTCCDSTVNGIRTSDGAKFPLTNAGYPARVDASCHPVNDNEFYYYSGTNLIRQLISTGATNVVHNFGTALGPLGGSLDIFDNTGQYMIVNLGTGGGVRYTVYDLVNNIVFSGGSTFDAGGGYATISPDGNNIIVVGGTSTTHKYKYAIDKTNHTVATADTQFTADQSGSDHGNLCWASDGNVYFVNINNDNNPALLQRTNIATGAVTTFFTYPTDAYFGAQPDHFSCVKRGTYKDWMFGSSDQTNLRTPTVEGDIISSSDPFTNWKKMQNEIYMVNILTGDLRRLAHHRSRQPTATWAYRFLPRVCAYWGGTSQHVAWVSNHGYESSPEGLIDLYMTTVTT